MGKLVKDAQIKQFSGFLKDIREDLGRNVTLHIPGAKKKCQNCLFDPVNKRSTGIYSPSDPFFPVINHVGKLISTSIPFIGGICPVCNGTGQTTQETTKVVKCLIKYLKARQREFMIYGVETENDFRLKADIKFENDFKNARIIEVDGVPTELTLLNRGGLRDLVQVIVFTKMSDWPEGKKKNVSSV